jgi:predicted negative regulator of RcsB-dependent stress response
MSELMSEQEQGEQVKNWLRENGSAIVMGLVLAFGLMFGFKQWQAWETSKKQQASAEYQVLTSLIEANNMDAAVANYEVLKSDFSKSSYTAMASMMMAKARLEAGQTDLAATALTQAMNNAEPAPVQIIARTRLARLRLSQGDADAAVKLLDGAPSDLGFEAQFAEIRGDIHLANGDTERAIQSYQASLDLLDEGVGNREYLIVKMEALGAGVTQQANEDHDTGGGEM